MRSLSFFWCSVPLMLAVGCVQSHRHPPVAYYPAVVAVPAPTSDRPEVRVYPETTPPAVQTPPGVSPTDVAIAQNIRQRLKHDPELGPAMDQVVAEIDNGVVTLRGMVPTEHDRDEIVMRVGRLPGVTQVYDRLGVTLR